ncbi:myrosinase 1-like [Copidosoma floridanum]|uniref:myrosinase 1-like n=1 Tax=Copidosoma floridanum TaxID=29053 RepID=UPI0006C94B0E|nr:myrosinase 1-like [Copidosoma floridanum]
MFHLLLSLMTITLVGCNNENKILTFPDGFLIGAASSAYQVEGAWNVDDKGISNWDHFVHHNPERIVDGSNADVTTDSYHRHEEDVNILSDLGVDHYRFSMSWSRILPKGHSGYVSKSALRYYHSLLDELDAKGIIPFVTIYHWDHPQSLEEAGGWLNDNMPQWFEDYARVIFQNFAHRVKYFVTLNELNIYCTMAYRRAEHPPAIKLNGTGDYQCLHNQLKAHALAYHVYDEEFRKEFNGQLGITTLCFGHFSKDTIDLASEDLAYEFECGWPSHPIFSETGDYPEVMKKQVALRSKAQGYKTSRLPVFSEDWVARIKGTSDFFGLNYYSSRIVKRLSTSSRINWPNDEGLEYTMDPKWVSAQRTKNNIQSKVILQLILKVVPEGLGKVLRKIREKYNNPTVYITENGVSSSSGKNDDERINYLRSHLKVILSAVNDGCNIKGYTYWSLLDSYEWEAGFTAQFGLMHVDFNDANRTRTPKKSVHWLKNVISTRKLFL